MRITREQIIDINNLVGHMILHTLGNNPETVAAIRDKGYADVELTLNGKTVLDVDGFVKHWQQQVAGMIDTQARELVRTKYNSVICGLDEIMTKVDEITREQQ